MQQKAVRGASVITGRLGESPPQYFSSPVEIHPLLDPVKLSVLGEANGDICGRERGDGAVAGLSGRRSRWPCVFRGLGNSCRLRRLVTPMTGGFSFISDAHSGASRNRRRIALEFSLATDWAE